MMYDGFGGWWWGMGLVHGLLWLVFVVLGIIVLVRFLGRESHPPGRDEAPRETALDIVKKRYARGEIDRNEFEAMKRDLAQ